MLPDIQQEQFTISAGKGKDATIHFEVKKDKKFMFINLGGEEATLDFNELWGAMFMAAGEKQQADMIPVKMNTVRHLQRIIEITLSKDQRKGDKIRFKYDFKIPEEMFVKENKPFAIASAMNQVKLKQEAKDFIN